MSENTMATKLQRLVDLNAAIAPIGAAYNPTNNSIKTGSLSAKETTLTGLNDQINPLETALNDKQEERSAKTYAQVEVNGFDGMIRQVRQIAGFVKELGEEHADKSELIRRAVNKIAPDRTRRKPLNENDRTRSTSEKSYDSMFAQAKKIAKIISDMAAPYNPADPTITAASFDASVTALTTLSEEIGGLLKDVTPLRKQREREMKNLPKLITSSKNYIKHSFGVNSAEYNSVKLI
jgi:hypothetical protein